ncbi:TetR/AcrR family transcriptional regulator [Nocardioides mangrovi]|uniref:TetR/AcrR family transcriptional regulator n=1 Tax=Nocardioides mangrovi TaxID=2874580 RepID=A0ABS7UB74_9ACTN|nr:TetR/AcrR family transcriptional regulator [Nocardioides mangrovi]MBZ5738221.1 TetR/AcrR family transcriptional regulator [Nocardioides mangrovi]
MTGGGRAPGRPRDTARQGAVLQAVREILADGGYPAVTFSDVAARAGVTRQLVYRWWPSRPDLVAEAIFAELETTWQASFPGPLEADLRVYVAALVETAGRPAVRAGVIGLMSDPAADDHELPGLEEWVLGPLEEGLRAIVDGAAARGEARSDLDVRLTMNTLRGAVVMHLVADGTEPDVIVDHLARLCAAALRP